VSEDRAKSKGLSEAVAKPHYLGHRERARERFNLLGGAGLADYELLELVLHMANPQRDTKALAKDLLARFGSISEVLGAPPARLAEVKGLGETSITISRSCRPWRSAMAATRSTRKSRSSRHGRS
jgi:DNA repair protein RadC